MPGWIRILQEVEDNWNALLQTLEGHSDIVWAVAFSADGKQLASASWGKMVLWDTASGLGAADARGPFGPHQGRGILAGRQALLALASAYDDSMFGL
jgi:hypothetical protein